MITTYKEVLKKYGNKYNLTKALEREEVYKIDKGYYSDTKYFSQLDYIVKKYPKIIFTFQSAYLYLGLSDYIPSVYYIASMRNSKSISFYDIKQTYESSKYFGLGRTSICVNGVSINTYDKERMLIELVRWQNKLPFDYYKEIINMYRDKIDELDMDKLMDYIEVFENGDSILDRLNREVF